MYSKVFIAFFYNCLILLGVISFAALFSLFTPKLISFLMTILTYIFISIANGFAGSVSLNEIFESFSAIKFAGKLLNSIMPRLGTLKTISNSIIMDKPILQNTGVELFHFIMTFSLLFFIIWVILNKKEI